MATVNEKMTAIADAIREKTGGKEALTLDDIASGVNEVYNKGYDDGYPHGYNNGYDEGNGIGYQTGLADGKQAEYDAFWDVLQQNGNRELYHYTFCNTNAYSPYEKMGNWNEENFLPKYPIVPKTCESAVFFGLEIDNFKEHCEKNGIVIDLSQATALTNFYRGLKTKYLPDVNAKSATVMGSTFYNCELLEESPEIINGELLQNINSLYNQCKKMKRIPRLWFTSVISCTTAFEGTHSLTDIDLIEGEIKLSVSFRSSPLSIASLKNVITHLKPYYGTENEFTQTLTVKASAWEALEAAGFTDDDYVWFNEISAESPNIFSATSWTDVVSNLGWNLVLA